MKASSGALAIAFGALGALLSTTSPALAGDDYYLGAERLMGLYWQRQSAEIEEGNVNQETSLHTTSVGVLGTCMAVIWLSAWRILRSTLNDFDAATKFSAFTPVTF